MYKLIGIMGVLALTPVLATGCTTANYALQERFLGNEKRDILVDRVYDVA
ncbi:hypothetical protein [uncultured Algimonas sp.]|nr:hypothetical protein [uncultured Algimonas sp.]